MENFECKICNYTTSRSNDLKKHEKTQKHLRLQYDKSYNKKIKNINIASKCTTAIATNDDTHKTQKKLSLMIKTRNIYYV